MSRTPRRPTMHDVARLAGVSQSTVSLILHGRRSGDARISQETRQRVQAAIDELGYVPNQTARSLRRRRTDRICLMISQLGVPYHDLLAQSLQAEAEAIGYSMVITVGGTPEREHQVVGQLRRGLADGALLVNPRHLTGEDLAPLARLRLALVVVSNHITGQGFDRVQTSEREECRRAVHYLYSHGHRRIAFLGSIPDRRSHRDRFESYAQALAELGLQVSDVLVQKDAGSSREKAYRNTGALLQLPEPPSAILAASDLAAVSAIWAIRDAGLRVPDDVAVIGVGNIPEGEISRPPLTTVGPSTLDFGDITGLLLSRLTGDAPPEGRVITRRWTLIVRGSA